MEKIKQLDNISKSFAEASAIDEAAENLGYSKQLIDARAKKITNEVYDDHKGEEGTNAGLKETLDDAEKNLGKKMKYIEDQITGYTGGEPLVKITTKEFEYYAALYKKDIADWTDTKYGGDYRLLDLGKYNDVYKLILKQEPNNKFRLCLWTIDKWNYEVVDKKEIEDSPKLDQALEETKIPKEFRKID
jgi:hypothetical protein